MNDKNSIVESFISAGATKVIAVYEACDIVITEQYEVNDISFTDSHVIFGSLTNGNVISINMDNVAVKEVSAEDSEFSDDGELLLVANDWRVTLSTV